MRLLTLLALCLLVFTQQGRTQPNCPPNVDFETGTYANWSFYTGNCCPINTPTNSGQLANRHVLVSGVGTDPYGGFPVVSPGGGTYSLKLGNASTGAQAEKARYYITVPASVSNFSLVYRYAVVFQNPNHTPAQQPRFEVNVYDAATNLPLACNQFTYVASSTLPGFQLSPVGTQVFYKDWTTATLDLSGLGGQTIIVDFATGDCQQSGHFGYGYIDLSCGLFAINTAACAGSTTTTLSAPFGFQTYEWWDATFSTMIGSGQTITIPTPASNTTYKVALTPYPGYGCPDTLSTLVIVSDLAVDVLNNDTTICANSSLQINSNITSSFPPVNISWSPTTGLSCTNCPNPIATPTTNTTYVLTASDASGCEKKDSVTINVSPQLTSTSQNVSCNGGNDGSATVTAISGVAPFSYNWNSTPIQTTATATNLPAGTYTVTVTDDKSCNNSQTVTITEPPLLEATISAFNNVLCFGATTGSATVNATGGTPPYTYSWNTTPVQTTANATGLTPGTYIATVTDSKNCTDTAMVTITEPTDLTVSTVSTTPTNCNSLNNGTATVSASGGTAPYSYSWNTVPVQNTAAATNLPAGTFTVTVTDDNGCIKTHQVTIGQVNPWNITINNVHNPSCAGGNNGRALAIPNGGVAPLTYSWNTTPVQTTPTAFNLTAGTYTVSITDALNCTITESVTITDPPVITGVITTTNANCFGDVIGTASVVAGGGAPPYTYAWTTSPVQTTTSVSNLPAGTYNVKVTDVLGCFKFFSTTITQPPLLVATMTDSVDVICFGDATGSATVTVTGGTTPYNYMWNTVPPQTTAVASNLPAGNYTVTVSDANGCTKSASVSLSQPSTGVVASIVSTTHVTCPGGYDGSIIAAASGGIQPYSFTWNTIPVLTNDTITNLPAGTFFVTVRDANNCAAQASTVVTQPPAIVTSVQMVNKACPGTSTGKAYALVTGGTGPYTYNWTTSPSQTTDTAFNLAAGTYTLYVADSKNCLDTGSITIGSHDPMISIGNDTTICLGDSASLFAGGLVTYTWSPASSLSCIDCPAPWAMPTAATTYQVTGTNINNCTETANITVNVTQHVPVAVGPELSMCRGESVELSATGGTAYLWSPANTLNINNISNPTAKPESNTRYSVIITENECFKDTLYQDVKVHDYPYVDAGADRTGFFGEEMKLNVDITKATAVQWTPETGLSCTDCTQPIAKLSRTIMYAATAINEFGCKRTDSVLITVACDEAAFFMANSFSPNGDGLNDTYYPQGRNVKNIDLFRIYNRWGEVMFETRNIDANNPLQGWDGRYKSQYLQPDVFVYMMQMTCPDGKPVVVKGDVSIVR